MSALAKVFVVFIFLLSIAFFGTTATLYKTRTDWRSAYNQYEATTKQALDKLQEHNASLRKQLDELQKDLIAHKANNTELGSKLKQTVEDLAAEKKTASVHASNAAKNADVAAAVTKTLESEKASYAQLQETLNKVKSDLDNAVLAKASADKARDSMHLDLEKSQQELHGLKIEHMKLSDSFDSQELVLNNLRRTLGDTVIANIGAGPGQIDAVVKAFDAKEKLVVLSAGKDQKVQLGYEFTVYRGGDFIGKVKVIKVFPDLCGAEVVLMKDGAEIQNGDKATTQL